MDRNNLLDVFEREMQCDYKGRHYLARDNGSIMRLPKEGSKSSKWDNVWTFGIKNPENGYMFFAGNIRVHQVVCTAFHGPEPEPHMVVDHIDTNRCNNRPENLIWRTRLENALFNDATRKKIVYLCGSVEAFIDNPSILRNKALSPDISWMRTVTKEEAAICKKHVDEWAALDSKPASSGKRLGDWIFSNGEILRLEDLDSLDAEEMDPPIDSLTPGVKQQNWKTPTEFLQIPQMITDTPLLDYLSHLTKGAIYCRNQYGESPVVEAAMSEDGSHLAVYTKISGVTSYALSEVRFRDGAFIHKSIRTFFTEEGAQKYFAESLGREWTGGDVFEDYC